MKILATACLLFWIWDSTKCLPLSIDNNCRCLHWDNCDWSKNDTITAKGLSKETKEYKEIQTKIRLNICGPPEDHKVYCCGSNQEPLENLEISEFSKAVKPILEESNEPIEADLNFDEDTLEENALGLGLRSDADEDDWLDNAEKDEIDLVLSNKECRSSKTDDGGEIFRHYGQLDTPCRFPFVLKGKTYHTCTYDYSHLTGGKPWCSLDTDDYNRHHGGSDRVIINGTEKKFVGICDDHEHCNIPPPPPTCGEPQKDGNEMPWLVSLGGYSDGLGDISHWDHQCAGSLVTNKHVLTSASCLSSTKSDWINGHQIRFGTSDLLDTEKGFERNIIEKIIHPDFENVIYFDVGIAVLHKRVVFSRNVIPVCLPMRPVDHLDQGIAIADMDLLQTANWGFFDQDDQQYKVKSNLQVGAVQVDSRTTCNSNELCASEIDPDFTVEQSTEGALNFDYGLYTGTNDAQVCPDDGHGSPVFKKITGTSREKPIFEQHYIASKMMNCEKNSGVYIRVTSQRILPWIQKVTETTPLLLAAGGYSYKPINDVEIISGTENRACSKSVNKLYGKSYLYDGEVLKESEVLGSTGQFVNGAAIVCGGKNFLDNLNTCLEFHPAENKWHPIPHMEDKRYYAASAVTSDDNLWVLGGSNGQNHSKITEVYKYQPNGLGKWNSELPLPTELQKSGVHSHCVVTLNSTHVFMAGGYKNGYRVDTNESLGLDHILGSEEDEIESTTIQNEYTITSNVEGSWEGGKQLNRAWMYDGSNWKAVEGMSITRDRPSCSPVYMSDRSVRVLVAGGCEEWCVSNPAMSSAEMYDPVTNTWTPVADLPTTINSAKMELLDGLPTIVGGYDGIASTQNNILYQYHPDLDQWKAHPDAKMRIARSSPAVFQVPRQLFPSCNAEQNP